MRRFIHNHAPKSVIPAFSRQESRFSSFSNSTRGLIVKNVGIFIFSLLIITAPAFSASFIVSPDGSSEYPTIQDAINAAAPGDSILLEDGVFSGAGNYEISFLGKDLILGSISGNPEDCIIDVMGVSNNFNEHGFFLNTRETLMSEIRDITIQGGDADGG